MPPRWIAKPPRSWKARSEFCSGRRAACEIQIVAADTAASTVWVEIQKRMDRRATVFAADPTNLSPKFSKISFTQSVHARYCDSISAASEQTNKGETGQC
jgi:hypothetical protein